MFRTVNQLEITSALEDKTYMIFFIDVVNQNSDKVKTDIIKIAETDFNFKEEGTLEWHYDDIDKILSGEYE